MILALAGNPNCGKTTLFNALTGANARTGNFPGVTVTRSTGVCRARPDVTLVDLPGVYALRPFSDEERVTRAYLLGGEPDAIISIADVTCPARSLYLTLQLLELGAPVVLALNVMDALRAGGGAVDTSVSIKSFAEGLSGKLQSGDIVSVIAPDYKQQGQTVVPAELQYVEIISVTASSGYDAIPSAKNRPRSAT